MGIGDEIMASAQARAMYRQMTVPVLVVDRHGSPRWHEIWENNPHIVRRSDVRNQRLLNSGGARPYILHKTSTNWIWRRWDIEPGEIYLSESEKHFAVHSRGRIVIEPHTKVPGGNKSWPWDRWQSVVDRFPHKFIQVGPVGTRWLRGVDRIHTTFRQACAVMAASKAYVGPEGAGHHAAAALGIPAVVLWSEFIDPTVTGYTSQRNIRHANGTCGSRIPCASCRASMAAITVDEVLQNLMEIVG